MGSHGTDSSLREAGARILEAALRRLAPRIEVVDRSPQDLPFPGFRVDVSSAPPLTRSDLADLAEAMEALARSGLPARREPPEEAGVRLEPCGHFALVGLEPLAESPTGRPLQRVLGIAARRRDELDRALAVHDRAAELDHRRLGPQLGLFRERPDGGILWLPRGVTLFSLLREKLRATYTAAGYEEVPVPDSGRFEEGSPPGAALRLAGSRGAGPFPARYFRPGPAAPSAPSPARPPTGLRGRSPRWPHEAWVRVERIGLACEAGRVREIWRGFFAALGLRYGERLSGAEEGPGGRDLAAVLAAETERWEVAAAAPQATSPPRLDFLVENLYGLHEHPAAWVEPDGSEPLFLHHGLAGSVEALVASLLEQTGGRLPFHLAPVQVRVLWIPGHTRSREEAERVHRVLLDVGLRSELDTTSEGVQFKTRRADSELVPCSAIVRPRSRGGWSLALRPLDSPEEGPVSAEALLERLAARQRAAAG